MCLYNALFGAVDEVDVEWVTVEEVLLSEGVVWV